MPNPVASRRSAPTALRLLSLLVGLCMALPLGYLLLRALQGDAAQAVTLLWRGRTLQLLGNTVALTAGVLLLATLIAFPLAWLVVRSDLPGRRLLLWLSILPLAVPGYVMAYALIGLSGHYGFLNQLLGLRIARLEGLAGATLALGLYTFPYLFLNLRSALLAQDAALLHSARSLGHGPWSCFFRVSLPGLLPALAAGWLVIALYTLGDFGAVALMRLDVFSSAMYSQYHSGFEVRQAAWLALMLLGMTGATIALFRQIPTHPRPERSGLGVAARHQPVRLGHWQALAWVFIVLVVLASVGLPLAVTLFWLSRATTALDAPALWNSIWQTASLALPTAAVATLLALLCATLAAWWPGRNADMQERAIYFGYAIPGLPLALAVAFFSLHTIPALYQSHAVLVLAYCISFMALAYGPIKNSLMQTGRKMHDSSLMLGVSPGRSFCRITLPVIRPAVFGGGALILLMVIKELPITYLLAPIGIRTLSMEVFSRTNEGMMLQAAPYALLLMAFSSLFMGLLLWQQDQRSQNA